MYSDREKLRFGNSTCHSGHPLWLVSEGYAYCVDEKAKPVAYFAWRTTEPARYSWISRRMYWEGGRLQDGTEMWVTFPGVHSLDTVLEIIQEDMAYHQSVLGDPSPLLPYDEWLVTVK